MFVIMMGLYIAMLLDILPETKHGRLQTIEGALIVRMMWMTVLFLAMWLRQMWARYVLVVSEILAALGFVAALVEFLGFRVTILNPYGFGLMAATGLGHVVCVWLLITSRDIKRLANRTYGI